MNKSFYSKTRATQYFYDYCDDEICFLIYDLENDVYSVVDEDQLRHLQNEFNLAMDILMES